MSKYPDNCTLCGTPFKDAKKSKDGRIMRFPYPPKHYLCWDCFNNRIFCTFDEFIWIPEFVDGIFTFTLQPRTFSYTSNEKDYTFIANNNEFKFQSSREFAFVANNRYFSQIKRGR